MAFFKRNIQFTRPVKLSAWRKIALSTWRTAADPSIYAFIDLDARPLLRVIEEHRARGVELTPTTIIAKALAMGLESYPRLNSMIRLGGISQRKNVDIFLQVSTDDVENLSGVKIEQCNVKTLQVIGEELKKKGQRLKKGDDYEYKKVKDIFRFLPVWAVKWLVGGISFIINDLNIWSPLLNTPRDGFGSAMVTSVGMLGIETALAPLVPYSRCPVLLTVGKITDRAVVENGEIIIRPSVHIGATVDHRLADGMALSQVLKTVLKYLADPR